MTKENLKSVEPLAKALGKAGKGMAKAADTTVKAFGLYADGLSHFPNEPSGPYSEALAQFYSKALTRLQLEKPINGKISTRYPHGGLDLED